MTSTDAKNWLQEYNGDLNEQAILDAYDAGASSWKKRWLGTVEYSQTLLTMTQDQADIIEELTFKLSKYKGL